MKTRIPHHIVYWATAAVTGFNAADAAVDHVQGRAPFSTPADKGAAAVNAMMGLIAAAVRVFSPPPKTAEQKVAAAQTRYERKLARLTPLGRLIASSIRDRRVWAYRDDSGSTEAPWHRYATVKRIDGIDLGLVYTPQYSWAPVDLYVTRNGKTPAKTELPWRDVKFIRDILKVDTAANTPVNLGGTKTVSDNVEAALSKLIALRKESV